MKVYVRVIPEKPVQVREYNIQTGIGLNQALKKDWIDLSNYVIFYNGIEVPILPISFNDGDLITLVRIMKIKDFQERFY